MYIKKNSFESLMTKRNSILENKRKRNLKEDEVCHWQNNYVKNTLVHRVDFICF